MISPQEIRTVTFDKAVRGYRTEDVDAFLQQVAEQMEQLTAEKEDKEQKLYILAQKIEEYRKDEDNLKTALLNAQCMGENVIKEAKQKAESILREAGIKAEDITRAATEQVQEEQLQLESIKAEVAQFKNNVLSLYKQHIESLSTLPGGDAEEEEELEPETEAPAEPEAQAAEAPVFAALEQEPAAPAAEKPEEPDLIDAFPDLAALYGLEGLGAEPGQEPDGLPAEEPEPAAPYIPQAPAPEKPASSVFEGFQGIKFSD